MSNPNTKPVEHVLNSLATACLSIALVLSFILPSIPILFSLIALAVMFFVVEAILWAVYATHQQV